MKRDNACFGQWFLSTTTVDLQLQEEEQSEESSQGGFLPFYVLSKYIVILYSFLNVYLIGFSCSNYVGRRTNWCTFAGFRSMIFRGKRLNNGDLETTQKKKKKKAFQSWFSRRLFSCNWSQNLSRKGLTRDLGSLEVLLHRTDVLAKKTFPSCQWLTDLFLTQSANWLNDCINRSEWNRTKRILFAMYCSRKITKIRILNSNLRKYNILICNWTEKIINHCSLPSIISN